MSIRIRAEACVGCGRCVEACPGNLIKLDGNGKACIRRPRDCWGCAACVKECNSGAIRYYLGADIGGIGAQLHTVRDGPLLNWVTELPDGESVTISVDSREANKY